MSGTQQVNYLFLDLNSYFASVEQQENPALRGRPVAVVPTLTDHTCAIAASYEAKRLGVKTGTIIREARKMCPGLITVKARHDLYVDYHHAIMGEVERHLPIETVHSIDEVACRLIGQERKTEAALGIARAIKRGIAEAAGEHVKCSIGLSANSYLAKVATDLEKPDGLVALYLEELPERILHFPLTGLPWIGRNIERRLNRAGVRNMASLWALPPGRLREIWGSVMGQRFWYMLHGVQVPPIEIKKRTIGHSHVLAPDLRPNALAHLVARRLMMKAAARMRRAGYWAGAASLHLRFVAGSGWSGETAVPPTQDSFTLLRAVDRLWEGVVRAHGPQAVKQVGVVLSRLAREPDFAADLFCHMPFAEEKAHRRRISLSRALDHLNYRYGRDTIMVGPQPRIGVDYVGAKIAFTRIPAREEFRE